MTGTTKQDFWDIRTSGLVSAGSQVDAISYCTRSSGFGLFTHNTSIGEIFTCTEDRYSDNKVAYFLAQGTDALQMQIEFCRDNDLDIFWNMRMNDTHDAVYSDTYDYPGFPQLKKDHPEYLFGKNPYPLYGCWSGVDYGRTEIRQLAFQYIEEVCQNYDIDGIDLDFYRHPVFFSGHAFDGKATAYETSLMTDLMRDIRSMTETEGMQRGKPILVAVRVPDSIEYAMDIGLDIETWMDEGLIDIYIPSGYSRLNPWSTSVTLAHNYNIQTYPCLSESRCEDSAAKAVRSTDASYRSRAMNVHASGGDGIYMFNFFDDNSPLWSQIGDADGLSLLDKTYTTGARDSKFVLRFLPAIAMGYLNRDLVNPLDQLLLESSEKRTQFYVGDPVNRIQAAAQTQLKLRYDPVSVFVSERISTEASHNYYDRIAENTINLSGMNIDVHDNDKSHMWMARKNIVEVPELSGVTAPCWIRYDFDKEYTISSIRVWNFNMPDYTQRGLRNIDVYAWTALDGWQKKLTYEISEANGLNDLACHYKNAGSINAEKIYIVPHTVDGNWGDADYYGLSEIRFMCNGTPVPIKQEYDINDITVEWENHTLTYEGKSGIYYLYNIIPSTIVNGNNSVDITLKTSDFLNTEDISADASHEYSNRVALNTINHSGMDANLIVHDNNKDNMWMAAKNVAAVPELSGVTAPCWIRYDFDKEYTITSIRIWNFNMPGYTQRGLRNIDVYAWTALDGWQKKLTYEIPEANGLNDLTHYYRNAGNMKAEKIYIIPHTVDGNWGDAGFYGLSEIRFVKKNFENMNMYCSDMIFELVY